MNILSQVIAFIADQNIDAYFVGGLVRDELLGRTAKRDIDLAIDGNAAELARAFADLQGGAFYLMDEEHDVARVILGDTYVDFARLRGDLRADLATRDFTINAMARQLGSNELIDPFHGQKHLLEKQICSVSETVFQDDPVRLLRALRFAGELDFEIGGHTEKLMRRDARLLAFASMERARDEFCKILALPKFTRWLARMNEWGMMAALFPEIAALKDVTQSAPHVYNVFDHTLRVLDELESIQTQHYAPVANGEFIPELQSHFDKMVSSGHARGIVLRLTSLLHDVGKAVTRTVGMDGAVHFFDHENRGAQICEEILQRLRFSNDESDIVLRIVKNHLRPPQLTDEPRVTNRAIYRFFRDMQDAGIDVCVLALADRRGTYAAETLDKNDANLTETLAIILNRYFRAPAQVIAPPALIDGKALMRELKLEPGKRVGELLEAIREAQVEGEVKTREDALAFARKLLAGENEKRG